MSENSPRRDATHHALGRLTHAEEVQFKDELAHDPELAADLRESEDAIVNLWQAQSPPQRAPLSAWHGIEKQLLPPKIKQHPGSRIFALIGWAAALVMLSLLLFRTPKADTPAKDLPVVTTEPAKPSTLQKTTATRHRSAHSQELHDRIRQLQAQLTAAQSKQTGDDQNSPRILQLHSAGSTAEAPTGDRSKRLLDLLTNALQTDLRQTNEEPVTLVIENGWLPEVLKDLDDESIIRHRDLPIDRASELGFLTSAINDYYDPSTRLLWAEAEDGGGHLGKVVPPDFDLSNYQPVPPSEEISETRLVSDEPPSGYLISDPVNDETTIIVTGLSEEDSAGQIVIANANNLIPATNFSTDSSGFGVGTISNSGNDLTNGVSVFNFLPNGERVVLFTTDP